mmetsp:Transcript_12124/g.14075  ORF Transcript_12124/g.14075 Transcript_12124/m.14075 type:complete len:282 (+) Transcript_12124:140-985(+)
MTVETHKLAFEPGYVWTAVLVIVFAANLNSLANVLFKGKAKSYSSKTKNKKGEAITHIPESLGLNSEYDLSTLEELRACIPKGLSGSTVSNAPKVKTKLDELMVGFIEQSPFVHLSTSSKDGLPFVSPKGDAPGFVKVVNKKTIIIPDRPGNKLIFGLQNIIDNPHVGLCFQIPGTCSTLRVGGRAQISNNPELLHLLAARRRDAVVAIRVTIEYAFFHCAKAYLRSNLWKPETWPREKYQVNFGQYFTSNSLAAKAIDYKVEQHYKQVVASVEGDGKEPN